MAGPLGEATLSNGRKILEGCGDAVRRRNPELFRAGTNPSVPQRPRAAEPQCGEGLPLVEAASREASGGNGIAGRFGIRFTIYSTRPCDWDNYFVKYLQDCCIEAGIIPGDDWRTLEGQVITRKCRTEIEERTVIEIWRIE